MDNLSQIAIVPLITAVCYVSLEIYKFAVKGKKNAARLIPAIAGILGVALGITAYYTSPGLIPAENVLTAILIGAASGLAATGANQILKQMGKVSKDEALTQHEVPAKKDESADGAELTKDDASSGD